MLSYKPTARALMALSAAGALSLSGCGFKPLYGVNSASHQPAVAQQFSAIEIPTLPDRTGQQMRNLLIDSLHPSGAATDYAYRLNVTIAESVLNLGLQQNSTSTRGQVRVTVKYSLVDEKTGKTLLVETLRTSTGYNILINQFSSVLSQDDAEAQGLQQIANDMTQHIALYFATLK
jgi:LPS-assembly lipoprotein